MFDIEVNTEAVHLCGSAFPNRLSGSCSRVLELILHIRMQAQALMIGTCTCFEFHLPDNLGDMKLILNRKVTERRKGHEADKFWGRKAHKTCLVCRNRERARCLQFRHMWLPYTWASTDGNKCLHNTFFKCKISRVHLKTFVKFWGHLYKCYVFINAMRKQQIVGHILTTKSSQQDTADVQLQW